MKPDCDTKELIRIIAAIEDKETRYKKAIRVGYQIAKRDPGFSLFRFLQRCNAMPGMRVQS